MTRLEKALEKLSHLPKKEQNRFAAIVLDEAMWQETFNRTANKLDQLGKLVFEEIKQEQFKRMP